MRYKKGARYAKDMQKLDSAHLASQRNYEEPSSINRKYHKLPEPIKLPESSRKYKNILENSGKYQSVPKSIINHQKLKIMNHQKGQINIREVQESVRNYQKVPGTIKIATKYQKLS